MTTGAMSTGGMGIKAMGTEGIIGLEGRVSSSAPASSCPSGPTGDHIGSRMTTRQSSSCHPHGSMSNLHRPPSCLPSTGIIATPPKPTTHTSSSAQGAGGRCPPRHRRPHRHTPAGSCGPSKRGGLPLKVGEQWGLPRRLGITSDAYCPVHLRHDHADGVRQPRIDLGGRPHVGRCRS
jgi:hypothetical protein